MQPSQTVESRNFQVAVFSFHHLHQRVDHGQGHAVLVLARVAIKGDITTELADVFRLRVLLDAFQKPLHRLNRQVDDVLLVCSNY